MTPTHPEISGTRPRTGYVGSDFHMFSSRSYIERHIEDVFKAASESDFLVLNGDTFDFHWTTRATVQETIDEAVDWIADLAAHAPDCHIHFVLGNHDYHAEFIEAVEELVEETPNLSLHPFYLRLGDAVFLHGDVTDRAKPQHADLVQRRDHWATEGRRHPVMHRIYDLVTKVRLHRVVYFLKPRRLMARRLEYYLREVEAEAFEEINHVYFGHTHVPFTDHVHNGRSYHNTGSTIRGLKFNMMQIEVEH